MADKRSILIGKDEQLKVRAGQQTEPGNEINPTNPGNVEPTTGTLMVKDSSVT